MKVIFLDIDGVLNCKATPNPRKFPYVVDQSLLNRLNRLLAETGASIVLSSTWRLDPVGLIAAKFWNIPYADVCPDMPGRPRREEILTWLKQNSDATRFAVIDDEDDDLDSLPLFQPSARTGLTEEIVEGVASYLNGSTDRTMRCNRVKRALQNIRAVFERDKS